ncbi:MAG: hypothetical protein HFI74_04740 [Lachnospiraceae bacterium]|jgi:hypothetical protein|nr:hypothetical protein [Lachnospiraceae bacterium]
MVIDGFVFTQEIAAKKARKEAEGIQYVKSKVDMENPQMVLQMYHKLLKEQVFETPVGLAYMKELQNYLAENPALQGAKIEPIVLIKTSEGGMGQEESIEWYAKNLEEIKQKERVANFRKRRAEEKVEQMKKRLWASLLFCLFLFIVAAGMVVITMMDNHPNILNYENKLIQKYETWEKDLEQREQNLKEQQE